MQNGNFIAEDLMQVGGDRRREADFRDEENGGTSSFEHRAHACEIDGGLARAGNAMQKHAGKFALVNRLAHSIQRGLLRWIQIEGKRRRPRLGPGNGEVGRLLDDFDKSALHQRAQRGPRDLERLQRFCGNAASGSGEGFNKQPLVRVEFAVGGLEQRDLHGARGVVRRGNVFAYQPFLAHHSAEDRDLETRVAERRGSSRIWSEDLLPGARTPCPDMRSEVIEDAEFGGLFFRSASGTRGGSRHARKMQRHWPSSVMRYPMARLNSAFSGSMVRKTSPIGRKIVVGDPAAEVQQLLVEHRGGIEHAEDVFRGDGGFAVVQFDDDARHALLAERHEHASADDWRGVRGDTVGEDHVQRHGQGDVAEFGHWIRG